MGASFATNKAVVMHFMRHINVSQRSVFRLYHRLIGAHAPSTTIRVPQLEQENAMRKYSIQPGQGLGASVRLALVVGAAALTQAAGAAQPASAAPAKGVFTGTWTVQWCDKTRPAVKCGGLTVDLLQRGNRICGSHGAATAGLTRVDEGDGRSILGTAVGSTAVLTVRSGRSVGIALVTVKRQSGTLQWTRTEEIAEGNNGEDLVPVQAVLKPAKTSEAARQQFEAIRTSCNAYWDASR